MVPPDDSKIAFNSRFAWIKFLIQYAALGVA